MRLSIARQLAHGLRVDRGAPTVDVARENERVDSPLPSPTFHDALEEFAHPHATFLDGTVNAGDHVGRRTVVR